MSNEWKKNELEIVFREKRKGVKTKTVLESMSIFGVKAIYSKWMPSAFPGKGELIAAPIETFWVLVVILTVLRCNDWYWTTILEKAKLLKPAGQKTNSGKLCISPWFVGGSIVLFHISDMR